MKPLEILPLSSRETLPAATEARLRALIAEVLRVNRQFNLTAVREPEAAWERHIVDSLQALPTGLLDGARRVMDVGTGAGFPGLALALARPQLEVTLLEATGKKCRFLRETVALLELNARVVCERAEVAGHDPAERAAYDVAMARAVGSFTEVCELCLPLARVGGTVLLWRGEAVREELQSAAPALKSLGGAVSAVWEYSLPNPPRRFHLVAVEKQKPTPRRFPRRAGVPKKEPL